MSSIEAISKLAAAGLAAGAMAAVGACAHATQGNSPGASSSAAGDAGTALHERPGRDSAARDAAGSQALRPSHYAKTPAAGAQRNASGSMPRQPCSPPYYAPPSATLHPVQVATAARSGESPPARELPTREKGPPAVTRVIPIGRVPPAAERCPNPPLSDPDSER